MHIYIFKSNYCFNNFNNNPCTYNKSPSLLGNILYIQIVNTSLLLVLFTFNKWFSFIISLIIIRSLFIYITALSSNEKLTSIKINFLNYILATFYIHFNYKIKYP